MNSYPPAYPKIGLALSGGGARGFAHIGVLKALEEAQIPIHCLAGASMGGIIAAAYAAGLSVQQLEAESSWLARSSRFIRLLDVNPPRRGLLEVDRVRAHLVDLLGEDTHLEETRIPITLTAVDLTKGNLVFLQEGSLVDATLATFSVPGLLPPVEWRGSSLVDGGLLDNLPLDALQLMGADILIASDVTPSISPGSEPNEFLDDRYWPAIFPSFTKELYQAILIMLVNLSQIRTRDIIPDVLIRPILSPEISIFWGFNHAMKAILAGEKATQELIPSIKQMIA